jgi:hypothetical protein
MRPMHAAALLAVVALTTACPKKVTTFTPTPTTFTTFDIRAGTIDPDDFPCVPPTPPRTSDPTMPGASQVMSGYQDWRNTTSSTSGDVCTNSFAKRWEGVVTFDMSGVAADLATPSNTLTGTLTYSMAGMKVPQSSQDWDMCVASLQLASTAPTGNGLVTLTFPVDFPPSVPSSLGATTLPLKAPFHTVTTSGPATIDPSPPAPKASVDVSMLLSEWAKTKGGTMSIVFVPTGPTLAQMGFNNNPRDPVPVNRSTAECTTRIMSPALTVHVGR